MNAGEVLAIGWRGSYEDLCFTGHILVVDSNGKIVYSAGDPEKIVFARSSAKLFQAMVVLESGASDYYGITNKELSLICSSHSGEDYHVEAVREILKKAGLDESYLQCGTHYPMYQPLADKMHREGTEPIPAQEMCSGKHAGMLVTSKYLGDSLDDYYLPSHPHQQRILKTISEMCDYPVEKIGLGIDGCGVPVHAMPMYHFALGFARMSRPEVLQEKRRKASERIVEAIQEYPLYISGTGRPDARINALSRKNVFSKSGADGYYGLGIKDKGLGIAIKLDCGIGPVRDSVVVETLRQLGEIQDNELENFIPETEMNVYNFKKEIVGQTHCCFKLKRV
ncbi:MULTISPECIES: asparaginase [Clostridia]|uniref:asparaginase n=1 Tax=Clostridia TaxID=186801 RepID=UPI0015FB59C6|nr:MULTISPECIES: asparaginase [Clostridia]